MLHTRATQRSIIITLQAILTCVFSDYRQTSLSSILRVCNWDLSFFSRTYPPICSHSWSFICDFIIYEKIFRSLSIAYNEVRLYLDLIYIYCVMTWWGSGSNQTSVSVFGRSLPTDDQLSLWRTCHQSSITKEEEW